MKKFHNWIKLLFIFDTRYWMMYASTFYFLLWLSYTNHLLFKMFSMYAIKNSWDIIRSSDNMMFHQIHICQKCVISFLFITVFLFVLISPVSDFIGPGITVSFFRACVSVIHYFHRYAPDSCCNSVFPSIVLVSLKPLIRFFSAHRLTSNNSFQSLIFLVIVFAV